MDMYKEASRLKLRFTTDRGVLSVDQLWDLPLTTLATGIRNIKKVLKKNDDDELSFLEEGNVADTENELRFNLLKDVYLTKKKDNEEARTALENKAHNQKILDLIQQKKEHEFTQMSVEDLEKLLK
jgi:hypothetical protein